MAADAGLTKESASARAGNIASMVALHTTAVSIRKC